MKFELPEMVLGAAIIYFLMRPKPARVEEIIPEAETPKPIKNRRTIPYGFLDGLEEFPFGPPSEVPRVTPEELRMIHEIDP